LSQGVFQGQVPVISMQFGNDMNDANLGIFLLHEAEYQPNQNCSTQGQAEMQPAWQIFKILTVATGKPQ